MVMTVCGELAADEMGVTLMHEHVLINMMREQRIGGLLNDMELLECELVRFARTSGRTIIDLTCSELTVGAAPDPSGRMIGRAATGQPVDGSRSLNSIVCLRDLAVAAGINIVAGTGHYRDPYLDREWFDMHSVNEIAERMVNDIEEGIAGTDIRAGIIGEIGSNDWYISAAEERSFRAAARAHHRTGLTVSTHANRWPVGIDQLNLLAEENVDPRRVIVGHCDSVNIPEYHLAIAERGAYVQFDNIHAGSEYDLNLRVRFIEHMVKAGYLQQVLLSHDVCKRDHLSIEGGGGYTFIQERLVPALIAVGLHQEEIDELLIHNPARAVSGTTFASGQAA